jgi:hypothetical protein
VALVAAGCLLTRKLDLDFNADIDGHRCDGLTIPSSIIIIQQQPDIVIIDYTTHCLFIFAEYFL